MLPLRNIVQNAAPMGIPASYLGLYEHLDLAAKVGGFAVIVLQGVYIGVCIWKKLKGGKKDDAE